MTHRTRVPLAAFSLLSLGLLGPALAQPATTVRIGFFPNLTHAPALDRRRQGVLHRAAQGRQGRVKTFVSGTTLSEAFAAGPSTSSLIGPGPGHQRGGQRHPGADHRGRVRRRERC